MGQLQDLTNQYRNLCAYCDGFWEQVFSRYPDQCACAAGCSDCCELQSVNLLEAFTIARFLGGRDVFMAPRTAACPFLAQGRCAVYPARPLICRTHGLLLKSEHFDGRISASCPYNFATIDYEKLTGPVALDTDKVTLTQAKLNAAFCLLLGDLKRTSERVALKELAAGRINMEWFGPFFNH